MKTKRRVFVHLESSRGYGRELLKGIYEYNNRVTNWEIIYEPAYYLPSELVRNNVQAIRTLRPDGCILEYHENMDELLNIGIPIVQTTSIKKYPEVPSLVGNYDMDGQVACEYFRKLGFQHLGFFGVNFLHFSVARHHSFMQYAEQHGMSVDACIIGQKEARMNHSDAFHHHIHQWLVSLPKPIGILACNDDLGQILTNACSVAKVEVPYEVAVLGVDNDELLCNITVPNLSSIKRDLPQASAALCSILEQIMNGQPIAEYSVQTNPIEVVVRQSTDTIASDDTEVVKAIAYIRENINRPISVEEVADQTTLSRRRLNDRFKAATGTSVQDEIQFRRLQKFKQLLKEQKLSIKEIAYILGFPDSAHVSRWFAAHSGLTPKRWREENT